MALAASCAPVSGPAPLADLAGTGWRVVAVNQQLTPPAGDYSMRFDRSGGVGVRLGCNHMGGRYRVSGGSLLFSDLATTLIGCPEPSATFEQQGGAIMALPMQMAFTSNERLMLSNERGSIALDPAP